jgi:Rrf2 family protein
MLITRETDYALRILRTLSRGERLTAGNICKQELLPQQFVYKILKKMEQAGFVHIARGAVGGCSLNVDLKKVSLYDVIESMDAEWRISACMKSGFHCVWRERNAFACSVHKQLSQIQEILDNELRRRSVHQILFEDENEAVKAG